MKINYIQPCQYQKDDMALVDFLQTSIALSDVFEDLDKALTTINHLTAIQHTIKQYGCTEALISLYGDNNISLSAEGVGDAIRAGWEKIKEFIKKFWKFIVTFFQQLIGVRVQADAIQKDIEKTAAELRVAMNSAEALTTSFEEATSSAKRECMGIKPSIYADLFKEVVNLDRMLESFANCGDTAIGMMRDNPDALKINAALKQLDVKIEELRKVYDRHFDSEEKDARNGHMDSIHRYWFEPVDPFDIPRRTKRITQLFDMLKKAERHFTESLSLYSKGIDVFATAKYSANEHEAALTGMAVQKVVSGFRIALHMIRNYAGVCMRLLIHQRMCLKQFRSQFAR